jgi:hypothetical protein
MPHLWRSSSTRGSSLVGGAADGVDDDASRRPEQLVPHPSFPTPVQDPEPSEAPRRTIGDSELSVFPVVLGGSVFGWTVDPDTTSWHLGPDGQWKRHVGSSDRCGRPG